jgi:hypothetical protein
VREKEAAEIVAMQEYIRDHMLTFNFIYDKSNAKNVDKSESDRCKQDKRLSAESWLRKLNSGSPLRRSGYG